MDRHAQPGEDARAVQHRLYREAMGLPPERECTVCSRKGRPWSFEPIPPGTWKTEDGFPLKAFRCRARPACRKRLRRRGWTRRQLDGKHPT